MLPPDAALAPVWLVASRVPDRLGQRHVGEAPAQQGGRVAPGVQVAVHHRGHQGVAAAGGGADEGAARLGRPAGLDPDGAAVVQQQPVLGVDLEGLADLPGLGHLAGELRLDRGDVVAEVLTGHRGAGEDREVVGRGVLPRRVQPAGVADRRVERAQALARWRSSRPRSAGPRRRRSPGRWPRRCPTPGTGPGTAGAPCRWRPARRRPGCPRRWRPPTARCRRRPGRQLRQQRERGEHLQGARRAQPPVRVLGGQHLAGVEVRQQVRRGRRPWAARWPRARPRRARCVASALAADRRRRRGAAPAAAAPRPWPSQRGPRTTAASARRDLVRPLPRAAPAG